MRSALDFRKQLPPLSVIMTPAMHNVISDRDGRRYNIMILPDKQCLVNQGLSSTRGGQMASVMYTGEGMSRQRLHYPMVFTGDDWVETNWDYALKVYAGVTKRILDEHGADEIAFNAFDHGGAGGGFENTWGSGKLMFTALQTQMVRIHNRPAYNSECHATRDMGIGELNNSYEDSELADTLTLYRSKRVRDADELLPRPCADEPDMATVWARRSSGSPASRWKGPGSSLSTRAARLTIAVAEQVAGQAERAAPGIAAWHRHGSVQRALDLCRRQRLARQRLHR